MEGLHRRRRGVHRVSAARSWTSGDGPKAIFTDGVGWLRERKVLLPGVTVLARLVARVRDDTTKRLFRGEQQVQHVQGVVD
ncbi:hypothetical protein CA984_19295 [Streptosporangium minutum]|uniref:DUF4158 domain-containing protein n=1 Tax=Streptosporangium minutum TaxID=569862 RepID=A0A243RLY1_9ACTN|nr:hypothetical protein CA984_19295 [Streptosporangium minutum]